MKFSVVFVLFAALLFSHPASSQKKTITIRGEDKVTFNPSRVNQTELMHWLKLSPALTGGYLLKQDISSCPENDSRYTDCRAQWNAVPSVHNAAVNVAIVEKTLRDLDTYPTGLSEVVAYARRWQEFGLWVSKAQLAFLQSGSVSGFEEKYGSIEPRVACGYLLDPIPNANTTEEAWQLLHVHWHNCVLAEEREHIGKYPQEAWNAFLKANGVHEQPIPETAD